MLADQQLHERMDIQRPYHRETAFHSLGLLFLSHRISFTSSERSREENEALEAGIFDRPMSYLKALLLEVIKKRRVVDDREAILFALNIISVVLCESESARSRAPIGLLEAVLEVIQLVDADFTKYPGFYAPPEKLALKETKERMRTLGEMIVGDSRGLGGDRDVQVRMLRCKL